jgi:outer membrane protein OmpA-like peptidoglycan-associated protein
VSLEDKSSDELWAEIKECLGASEERECVSPTTTLIKPVRVVTVVHHETVLDSHSAPCPPGSVHLTRKKEDAGPCQERLLTLVDERLSAHKHERRISESKLREELLRAVDARLCAALAARARDEAKEDQGSEQGASTAQRRLSVLLEELRSRERARQAPAKGACAASSHQMQVTSTSAASADSSDRLEFAMHSVHVELRALRELLARTLPTRQEGGESGGVSGAAAASAVTTGGVAHPGVPTHERTALVQSSNTRFLTRAGPLASIWILLAAIVIFICGALVHATFGGPREADTPRSRAPLSEPENASSASARLPGPSAADSIGGDDTGAPAPEPTPGKPRAVPPPLANTGDKFEDPKATPDRDDDGDGIPTRDDDCPLKPETVNGFLDDDGCPDVLPEAVAEFSGVIEGINFDVDRARLRAGSLEILDRAVAVFTEFPGLRVEISGHTDSTGNRQHNLALSLARAAAVRRYLVKRGVKAADLEAIGYGPDRPIARNTTREDRQRNRRIEFRVLTAQTAVTADAKR